MIYPGHLLLISLGPIQDFIASARRCQDLWFGSWMLSDLSRAIARSVKAQTGEEALVFPASLGEQSAVANKVLAMVPGGTQPKEVATEAFRGMDERLTLLKQAAFERFDDRPRWKQLLRWELLEQQLQNFLELQWVATPLSSADAYGEARKRCETLLANRKNTRSWPQFVGLSGVPKSSLDGVRESVLMDGVFKLSESKRRNRYGVKGNEQLCGVSLLKRLGCELDTAFLDDEVAGQPAVDPIPLIQARNPALLSFLDDWQRSRSFFHSTSHMAATPLLTRVAVEGTDGGNAVREYVNALQGLNLKLERRYGVRAELRAPSILVVNPFTGAPPPAVPMPAIPNNERWLDAVLFYEGRMKEVVAECSFDVSDPPTSEDKDKLSQREGQAIQALRVCLQKLGVPRSPERPTAYYALLLADGDFMGRAIDLLGESPGARAHHATLAKALDEGFSPACREIVEHHGGSLIYAGGDDVLALLPLHSALACARKLHDHFEQSVVKATALFPIEDPHKQREKVTPTLSVGIAIGHHLELLHDVRKRAKDAESIAKSMPGKDALAIVASKRSGGDITVRGYWRHAPDVRLVTLAGLLRDGALPDGVAWHLEEVLAPFTKDAHGRYTVHADVVERLTARVLQRRRAEGGEGLVESVRTLLEDGIAQSKALYPQHLNDAVAKAVLSLSEEVQMARMFLTAWTDAWGEAL